MKVGVFLGCGLPEAEAGGGFTFQSSLIDVIKNISSKHEFVIFHDGVSIARSKNKLNISYVSLQRFCSRSQDSFFKKVFFKLCRSYWTWRQESRYQTLLNKATVENNIDLMWFMTPSYRYVEVPYMYTVWDLQHRRQSFFPEVSVTGSTFEDREKHFSKVIPRATYVITGNHTAKEEVIRFYGMPDERVKMLELPTSNFVFDLSIEDINVVKKYGISSSYLFYPAQFWPHKNHITILQAVKELNESYKLDLSIVFTGSDKGNLGYIKDQAKILGLEERVYFLGFVSTQELVSLYKQASMLIFASFFGPDNIPPLEAMALGCPVIAADVAGAREQLGEASLFFDPKNSSELAVKIKKIYEDHVLRNNLIKKGRKRALSWTSEHYIKGVLEIIDEFEPIRKCWSSKERYVHT